MALLSRTVLSVALLTHFTGYAQTEYLVTVDPGTGVHSIVGPIEGVVLIQALPSATVVDENNGRFIFKGSGGVFDPMLYTVDHSTATVLSSPVFPATNDPNGDVVELQFDNSTGILYGLSWNSPEQTEHLVSVDPSTGVSSEITPIAGVTLVVTNPNYTTFDQGNGRFIFLGMDNTSTQRLYSVDVNTGDVVSAPSFPSLADPMDNLVELQFDNGSGTLYGLYWDDPANTEYLVSVDPSNGQHTVIAPLPSVRWINSSPHFTTFDEVNGHYIFRGANASFDWHLYSVDVNTGSIVANAPFPILEDPEDNVVELKLDNATRTLYALHWDAHTPTVTGEEHVDRNIRLYPNPFDDHTTITLDKIYGHLTVDLFDANGRLVRSIETGNVQTVELFKEDLVPGMYYIRLSTDASNILRSVMIR